jgi:hypothetical protein
MSQHYRFISGSSPRRSTPTTWKINVDNLCAALRYVSWFCHIEAARVRFVVWVLMFSGENSLGAAAIGTGGCKSSHVAEQD